MFPEKIHFDGENYRTNDLQIKKTEEQDQKSLSSVYVPGAGLFSEPFLRDLELIYLVDIWPGPLQVECCQNAELTLKNSKSICL